MTDQRPPFPPFDEAAAWKKVLGAEAAWNTRGPEKVAGARTAMQAAYRFAKS